MAATQGNLLSTRSTKVSVRSGAARKCTAAGLRSFFPLHFPTAQGQPVRHTVRTEYGASKPSLRRLLSSTPRHTAFVRRATVASSSVPSAGDVVPPEETGTAYGTLATVYSALVVFVSFAPRYVIQHAFTGPLASSVSAARLWAVLQLPLVASLYVLKEAAIHGRLSSETYQRLNLGVFLYAAVTGVTALLSNRTTAFTPWGAGLGLVLLSATALVASATYARTSGRGFSFDHILTNFVRSVENLLHTPNSNSALYALISAVTFSIGAILVINPGYLRGAWIVGALGGLFAQWTGASLLLTGVVAYVLKDAADRNRLGGSTFKTLNNALVVTVTALVFLVVLGPKLGLGRFGAAHPWTQPF